VTGLSGADPRFRDDRGEVDEQLAAALAAYADGVGAEHAALSALASSRLLVPVVAAVAESAGAEADGAAEADGGDKHSEMAVPSLVGHDGRLALLAFTCTDSLRRWQPAARPVPVPARRVFEAAVAESSAVVVDVAGPVSLTIEGARLAALAAGGPAPGLHEDPDVWAVVAAAAGSVAPGIRIRLGPPPAGAAVTLELAPPPGSGGQVAARVAAEVAAAVHARLGNRVRPGIAVLRRPG